MHLEKLEVVGFKSFADRTEFSFDTGLSAVVGPNGCGKSNIVDAIKWVMGEQSVKSLRGSEMSDVIFNGTTHRKPFGYAEASLIFSNTKNLLPIDFDQVRVTRRLYRTGESEYLLNKARCRLRDIRELFLGTGVANNAYSVIEQGKVDVLLQANPQERRAIFEEAAGISKYKAKKKTALNKLDRVEQNLVRLSDIIAEVQKQMKSLHRQAGKARRFREYSHQLKDLKVGYYLHQFHVLSSELSHLNEEVEIGQANLGKKQAEIEKLEAEESRLSTLTIDIEQALRDKETQRAEIEGQIQQSQTEIRRAKERIDETKGSCRRHEQEIRETHKRLHAAKVELLEAIDGAEQTQADLEARTAQLREVQEKTRLFNEQAAQFGRQLQNIRSELMELFNEIGRHNSQRAALESSHRMLEGQLVRGRERSDKIRQDLSELNMVRGDLEAALELLTRKLQDGQTRLRETNDEISHLQESLLDLDGRLTEQRDLLTGKEARKQTLQDLERRREGMGAGVKQVLNAIQGDSPRLHGVVGTVAELFEVDVDYAVAIEAALATAAQAIVTKDTDHTRTALDFLAKDDRGRATFLPMDRVRTHGSGHAPVTSDPDYVGRALDFISVSETNQPVLAQLLMGTHLVRNFETALALAPKFSPSSRFVTLSGDVVCSSGPITGGGAVDRVGIISRKSELRHLDKELAEIRELMARLSGERDETNQRLEALRHERETIQAEISDTNLELSDRRTRLDQTRRDIEDREQEEAVLASEIDDTRRQIAGAEQQMDEIDRLVTQAEAREAELTATRTRVEEEMESVDRQRESLRNRSTELQTALATLRQKVEGQKITISRSRRAIQEHKDLLLSRFNELDECARHIRSAEAIILENEEALRTLFRDRHRREQELRIERERLEEVRRRIEQNGAARREAGAELRELEEQTNGLKLQRSEAQMRRETLLEQAQSELGIDLHDSYKPDEHDDDEDWEAVREDVRALERRIQSLGNVYEDAIEEYEKLELRYHTLNSQEQDLIEAKKKLQQIIRKINHTSRRLFETTFSAVRENFQDLFSKLFGGGKADIFLEEGVDILEAGIEIVARPPGKSENTVLSLLSGGEKALCTVALLFAIFKARPSPFCILDEVDAPLDESNIDRYVTLIQEFNQKTQFIIVTHNRRTMRAADTIYGVTMQEPGVSTKVSVRFEDVDPSFLE